MFGRTVGAFALAASALTAQAILLPPGITSVDGPNRISSDWAIDTVSQAIKLPCSECAFSMNQDEKAESADGDDLVWIQGGANSVLLNFSLVDNGMSVAMNGRIFYPLSTSASAEYAVEQVASSASFVDIKTHKVKTRPLKVSSSHVTANEEEIATGGDAIVRIIYQITSLEQQQVSFDGAEVLLVKDAAGRMQILSVQAVPHKSTMFDMLPHPATSPEHASNPETECGTLPAFICKLKNAVESKVGEVKASLPKHIGGCSGKKSGNKLPGHIKPHIHWEGDESDKPRHHHGRPPVVGGSQERPHGNRPGRPHHGHNHHGHHGHFLHRLLKGFVMVLIPIMAGITMGMIVSLIGMLVGRLIAFVWIKFRRGGQRGYASVNQEEDDTQIAEKGEMNAAETEPLPMYEEAPPYEETEARK